jgi:uncharacterized protein (DUF3084 family)
VKIVLAFVFGLLTAFGVMGYMVGSGAADLFIQRTEGVRDLQKRLREVEQERDQLGRQLDDVVARSTRMENSFSEIERRFRDLQEELSAARGERHAPALPAPASPARPEG